MNNILSSVLELMSREIKTKQKFCANVYKRNYYFTQFMLTLQVFKQELELIFEFNFHLMGDGEFSELHLTK